MRYYVAIFTTIVFFSTVEVVTKLVGHVDANLLAFLRFFPSGVVILLLDVRQARTLTRRDFLGLAFLGFIGITLTFSAYHGSLAMEGFPASTGAVIFSINPVFCALAASILLKERLTFAGMAGILLGFAGVYVVSFGFRPVAVSSVKAPLMMFAAQICFGIYVVAAKKYVAKYGPFFVNGVIFITGSILFIPLVGDWSVRMDVETVSQLAYLSLLATGAAYVLYFYGLNRVSVAAGTSLFYLKPVLAPLLALQVLEDESLLTLEFLLGVLIIFASLTLTILGGRKAAARKETPTATGAASEEPTRP